MSEVVKRCDKSIQHLIAVLSSWSCAIRLAMGAMMSHIEERISTGDVRAKPSLVSLFPTLFLVS
jgi:hypothetical protein